MSATGKERLEVFQRAVAATTRAIAHRPNLAVSFRAGEPARETGKSGEAPNVRLPVPRRDMAPGDLGRVRGEADGVALRLRHHDAKLHQRLRPQGDMAAPIFETLEQIRVEALGASRMVGVAANLANAHAARVRPTPASHDTGDAGLADALELYAQETLLGFTLPKAERQLLDNWRSWLESRVGKDWRALSRLLADQEDFGIRVREMLAQLGLAEELSDQPDQDSDDAENDNPEDQSSADQTPSDGAGEDAEQQARAEAEAAAASADEAEAGAHEQQLEDANAQGGADDDGAM
ncbi:MAG: cobaltochelatase subunit CobT, partial [Nitrospirota bacterium]|nr:cobaltochelatase subunit CobT [Nitrospirota bacterium]